MRQTLVNQQQLLMQQAMIIQNFLKMVKEQNLDPDNILGESLSLAKTF